MDLLIPQYINKPNDFVNTIYSRSNRVNKLAPDEVTKKENPSLFSLKLKQPLKLVGYQRSTLVILLEKKIVIPFR